MTRNSTSHLGIAAIVLVAAGWLCVMSGLCGTGIGLLMAWDRSLRATSVAIATEQALTGLTTPAAPVAGSANQVTPGPPAKGPSSGLSQGPAGIGAPEPAGTPNAASSSAPATIPAPDASTGGSLGAGTARSPGVGTAGSPSAGTAGPNHGTGRTGRTGRTSIVTATPEPSMPVTPATPAGATSAPTSSGVDFPSLPDLSKRHPMQTTAHFALYAQDPEDRLLTRTVTTWAPQVEEILAHDVQRIGNGLPRSPVSLVFARTYGARCPARGLAVTQNDVPLILVFVSDATAEVQIRAVLAHEMVHQLTSTDRFVGDGVLTEGIANWGADDLALAWQGFPDWDSAVRKYLADGDYVSIADAGGQIPLPGEDCLARRDRVYNARTAFVGWLVRHYGLATVLAMPYIELAPYGSTVSGTPAAVPSGAKNSLVAPRSAPMATTGTFTPPFSDLATPTSPAGTVGTVTSITTSTSTTPSMATVTAATAPPAMLGRLPDYEAATGHNLRALEMLWLEEVAEGRR